MVRGSATGLLASAAGRGVDRIPDRDQQVGQRPTEHDEDHDGEQHGEGEDQAVFDQPLTARSGPPGSDPSAGSASAATSSASSTTSRTSEPSGRSSAAMPSVDARLSISRHVDGGKATMASRFAASI